MATRRLCAARDVSAELGILLLLFNNIRHSRFRFLSNAHIYYNKLIRLSEDEIYPNVT